MEAVEDWERWRRERVEDNTNLVEDGPTDGMVDNTAAAERNDAVSTGDPPGDPIANERTC